MPKFANPFTDFGFKNLFGKEYSKDILIDFLNELYSDLPGMDTIVDIRYSDKEMSRLSTDGKTVIYDIHCEIAGGHYFIVEMQVNSQSTFLSRAIYYLCRAISDQGEIGNDWRYDFRPVYGIYFTDFRMHQLAEQVKIHSKFCDLRDGKPISDKICLSFIQLPYFDKSKEDCITGFDQWIYVLKHLSTLMEMPFTKEKEIFAKVATVSDLQRLSETERDEYNASLKRYRDYHLIIETAEDEARKRGWEEGKEEGMKEGMEKGMEKGMVKGRNKIIIAMAGKGFTPEQISDLTDMPLLKIKEILLQNSNME